MIDLQHQIHKEFTREVYDHEILISFNSDEGAYSFSDWWCVAGQKLFEGWVNEKEKEDIQAKLDS